MMMVVQQKAVERMELWIPSSIPLDITALLNRAKNLLQMELSVRLLPILALSMWPFILLFGRTAEGYSFGFSLPTQHRFEEKGEWGKSINADLEEESP